MSGAAWDSMRAAAGAAAVEHTDVLRGLRGAPDNAVIVTPPDRTVLAAVVAAAQRDRLALMPIGTGRRARTPSTDRPFVYVSFRRLDRVVAHEVGDLTLTVECGASLSTISKLTAQHRQFVAFDAAHPEATLGGTLASAEDGSLAGHYGPIRDQVLGMAVVNGDGASTKAGGRVVKNVTGYDLVRLYTGSLGSLALLVEATLRLRPLPESSSAIVLPMPSWQDAEHLAATLRRSILDLTTLHIISGAAAQACGLDAARPAWLRCGLTGFTQSVQATREKIASMSRSVWSEHSTTSTGSVVISPPATTQRLRVTATAATWRSLEANVSPLLPITTGRHHDVLRGMSEWWYGRPWQEASRAAFDVQLGGAQARLDLPDDPTYESTLAREWPSQVPEGVEFMTRIKHALDPDAMLAPHTTIFG